MHSLLNSEFRFCKHLDADTKILLSCFDHKYFLIKNYSHKENFPISNFWILKSWKNIYIQSRFLNNQIKRFRLRHHMNRGIWNDVSPFFTSIIFETREIEFRLIFKTIMQKRFSEKPTKHLPFLLFFPLFRAYTSVNYIILKNCYIHFLIL